MVVPVIRSRIAIYNPYQPTYNPFITHYYVTAKATTNAELLESTTHASSLCCFSRVLFYNFTITDIYPTTEAVWGVVWETNLLLRASWIKSLPSRVALVLLLVVSHFLLHEFIILPTNSLHQKEEQHQQQDVKSESTSEQHMTYRSNDKARCMRFPLVVSACFTSRHRVEFHHSYFQRSEKLWVYFHKKCGLGLLWPSRIMDLIQSCWLKILA